MNEAAVDEVRKEFLRILPDFTDFEHPPQILAELELDYKHAAALKTRSMLEEYVKDERQFSTDDEAHKVLVEVIELTNFLNWRDKGYVIEQLFTDEGDWLTFGRMLLRALRA